MKKILLMMVAFVATMSAFAQEEVEGGWMKSFTPVAESNTPTPVVAQAGDGSVYVASQRSVAFTFASKEVPAPEIEGSGVILKYDKEGNEAWAVTLDGAVNVTAMTADKDGTLYVAGTFDDGAVLTDATKTANNIAGAGAFLFKVSKDGKLEVYKTYSSVAPTECDEYWGDLQIYPTKLLIEDNTLYVSANFKGEVADFSWNGSYANYYWGMAYIDNRSSGIFSLSKTDFSNATSVATLQATERVFDAEEGIQCYADAFNFTVNDGVVMISFVGFGNLTLTTPSDSKDYSFEMQGEGVNEHAFVGVAIKDGSILKPQTDVIYHSAAHASYFANYNLVDMYSDGETTYIGGTCWGQNWFDNTVNNEFNYAFIVSISNEQNAVNWTVTNPAESQAVAMVVTGKEVHAVTDKGNVAVETATGKVIENDDEDPVIAASASAWEDDYAAIVAVNENQVFVLSKDLNSDDTAVESIEASVDEDDVPVYNVLGQPIGPDYKGFAITKSGKKVYVK